MKKLNYFLFLLFFLFKQNYHNIIRLEFDAEVQRERLLAQESLRDIEAIRNLIDESFEKTRIANQTLNGAEANAVHARDIAKEAQVS